jgi:acetolactate synthase-1/2/3 large subunit
MTLSHTNCENSHDQSYGLIRWKQMLQLGRAAFVDFRNPDFVKYAESFNAQGFSIESADQLAPALHKALDSNHLSIIDCPVDVAENLLLTQRLGAIMAPTGDGP